MRVRVLERVRGVGVEEAAAVGAQHLDDFLRGDRPLGDHLLGALERGRLGVGAEILRHALPDEEQADDDADRQQDVERAAGEIDPEVADALGRAPGEAADQRDRQRDAGRGRDEVVHGEPRHLDEVAHRRLGHVGLPVGVGVEAHRRVEGEPFLDRRLAGRVERQHRLEAHQRVEAGEADQAEQQHRHGIGHPILVALLVDAAQLVEDALERAQYRREEGALAREDAGHVAAERLHEQGDHHAEQRDLKPTVEGH